MALQRELLSAAAKAAEFKLRHFHTLMFLFPFEEFKVLQRIHLYSWEVCVASRNDK